MAFAIEALEYHYHFGTDERSDTVKHAIKRNKTIFVRLPAGLQRPITGGCQCGWCKDHPKQTPCWDTLAVCEDGDTFSWTVHYPDMGAANATL